MVAIIGTQCADSACSGTSATHEVCPSDFGEPGTHLRFAEMAIEKTMLQQANMMRLPSQMFGRSLVAFPHVYWAAPAAKVAEMALVASQQRGLPVGTPWLNLLPSDMMERVLGNEKRIGQVEVPAVHSVMNLSQK